jgi:hypothetical protein
MQWLRFFRLGQINILSRNASVVTIWGKILLPPHYTFLRCVIIAVWWFIFIVLSFSACALFTHEQNNWNRRAAWGADERALQEGSAANFFFFASSRGYRTLGAGHYAFVHLTRFKANELLMSNLAFFDEYNNSPCFTARERTLAAAWFSERAPWYAPGQVHSAMEYTSPPYLSAAVAPRRSAWVIIITIRSRQQEALLFRWNTARAFVYFIVFCSALHKLNNSLCAMLLCVYEYSLPPPPLLGSLRSWNFCGGSTRRKEN